MISKACPWRPKGMLVELLGGQRQSAWSREEPSGELGGARGVQALPSDPSVAQEAIYELADGAQGCPGTT